MQTSTAADKQVTEGQTPPKEAMTTSGPRPRTDIDTPFGEEANPTRWTVWFSKLDN